MIEDADFAKQFWSAAVLIRRFPRPRLDDGAQGVTERGVERA